MTSDAKIGLLLGLVFIFIIAFVINGLPHFRSDTSTNELTLRSANAANRKAGLGGSERQISRKAVDRQIRFQRALSQRDEVVKDVQEVRPSIIIKAPSVVTKVERIEEVAAVVSKPKLVEKKVSRPVVSKFYVVDSGDNLASIAKKFYGGRRR